MLKTKRKGRRKKKKYIEGKILISTRRIHKNHIHREYRQTVMLKANANRNGKRISRMKKRNRMLTATSSPMSTMMKTTTTT